MTVTKNPVNKTEAFRRALRELGPDADRVKLQRFIKKNFGYTMSNQHIYNYKSAIRKEKPEAPVVAIPVPAAAKSAAAKPKGQRVTSQIHHTSPRGISLPDIGVVKGLLGRVGAEELKGLIDVLNG